MANLTVRIEIDSRERDPLIFPPYMPWLGPGRSRKTMLTVETVRKELPLGDYRLAHAPRAAVVERKSGLGELAVNLSSKDKKRFKTAWHKFITGCHIPILIVEGSLATTREQLRNLPEEADPERVLREVWETLLSSKPVPIVLWAGSSWTIRTRMRLGREILRVLMYCADHLKLGGSKV